MVNERAVFYSENMARSRDLTIVNTILVKTCKEGNACFFVATASRDPGTVLVAYGEQRPGHYFIYSCPGCDDTNTCEFKIRDDWRTREPCFYGT